MLQVTIDIRNRQYQSKCWSCNKGAVEKRTQFENIWQKDFTAYTVFKGIFSWVSCCSPARPALFVKEYSVGCPAAVLHVQHLQTWGQSKLQGLAGLQTVLKATPGLFMRTCVKIEGQQASKSLSGTILSSSMWVFVGFTPVTPSTQQSKDSTNNLTEENSTTANQISSGMDRVLEIHNLIILNHEEIENLVRNMTDEAQWDISVGKGLCQQARKPELEPPDLHGGRRESTHQIVLWPLWRHLNKVGCHGQMAVSALCTALTDSSLVHTWSSRTVELKELLHLLIQKGREMEKWIFSVPWSGFFRENNENE